MRWSLVLVLLVACKTRHEEPPAKQEPPAPHAPAAPALPSAGSAVLKPQTLDVSAATDMLPKLEGEVILAPKANADVTQVHATWCVPGQAADAAAQAIGTTVAAQGWTGISTRGDAVNAGIAGDREGYRLSIVVAASTIATCASPGHYMAAATLIRLGP